MNIWKLFRSSNLQKDTLRDVASGVGELGVYAAGIDGDLTDSSSSLQAQADTLNSVASHSVEISSQSQAISNVAKNASELTEKTQALAVSTSVSLKKTLTEASSLARQVRTSGDRLRGVDAALQRVRKMTSEIDNISQKTKLLALNAGVEAARAGANGNSFSVVAQEFKSLSEYAARSTVEINNTVDNLSHEIAELVNCSQGALRSAAMVENGTKEIGGKVDEVPLLLADLYRTQEEIHSATADITQAISQIQQDINAIATGVSHSSHSIKSAAEQLGDVVTRCEGLISATARMGVETDDTHYINAVIKLAAQIGRRFEKGLDEGEISYGDLFDFSYKRIPDTTPVQYTSSFLEFVDKVLPPLQEPMLEFSNRVVFCAAVDLNGYLPTHNKKFSQPQRPNDPDWNLANSRNRRIFDDRVGLAAGRNTEPFLLQAYRRDMGNGEHALMKDLSAPIFVHAHHWGGIRLAYLC